MCSIAVHYVHKLYTITDSHTETCESFLTLIYMSTSIHLWYVQELLAMNTVNCEIALTIGIILITTQDANTVAEILDLGIGPTYLHTILFYSLVS